MGWTPPPVDVDGIEVPQWMYQQPLDWKERPPWRSRRSALIWPRTFSRFRGQLTGLVDTILAVGDGPFKSEFAGRIQRRSRLRIAFLFFSGPEANEALQSARQQCPRQWWQFTCHLGATYRASACRERHCGGNNSATRLACCVGGRSSTSRR